MTATAVDLALAVSEVFTNTVQGEGPSLGRVASFIRLGGCNLHCTWCDTPYTWDASRYDLREQIGYRPVDDIAEQVNTAGAGRTVVTGGEPLLHQNRLAWARLLNLLDGQIEVETNGTQAPNEVTVAYVDQFNVSPKLAHAGDPVGARIKLDALRALRDTRRAAFKFVAATPGDLDEIDGLITAAGIPGSMVWVMAEGTTPRDIVARTAQLADHVVSRRWNLTTRLHVLAWGDERGR